MKRDLLILIMLLNPLFLTAQSITFEYDASGNRVKRYSSCSNEPIDLGDNLGFCSGSSLTLDAGEGFVSYTWNEVAGSRTLEVSEEGHYTVEAVDAQGCTSTGEADVAERSLPAVNLGPDQPNLPADAYVYLESDVEYQKYEWTGTNNTCRILCVPMQNVSGSVDISLTVTDEYGCVGTDQVVLTVDASTLKSAAVAESNSTNQEVEETEEEVAGIEQLTYNIYPNPTDGKFFIAVSNPDKVTKMELFSISGTLIKTFENVKHFPLEVDLSQQQKGLYLLRVSEQDGFRQFKIVHK